MKKNTLSKLFFALAMPLIIIGCDGDDEPGTSLDFPTIASTVSEADGGTITIPLRNASSTAGIDVAFGGTAVEGEDFTFEGISGEGVSIAIIDDNKYETNETIRVQLTGEGLNGNSIHTVTIESNCADLVEFNPNWFAEAFAAYEVYAPDDIYGPYTLEFAQETADNPNRLTTHNFWDSGLVAYIVYDAATNTVSFPTQTPQANFPTRIVTSTPATVDPCTGEATITTSYRGYTWDYRIVRPTVYDRY
jgi:hypothetical protein